MTHITFSRIGRRVLAPVFAASVISAGLAVPAASAEEPTGTCAVTKWNFDQAGVDVYAYSDSDELLAAVLEAKEYEEGKVGSRIVLGYWTDRVNESIDCGFVKDSSGSEDPAEPADPVVPEEPAKPEEPDLSDKCKTNKDQFAELGVDVDDYSLDRKLLYAALKADGYEADNFLHLAKFNRWNGRVDTAVDCGFAENTVIKEELEPGLNKAVPCASLNFWLNRDDFITADLTHGELSKKLRDSNRGDRPLGNLIGVEYFDDIADRALQCRLVEPDANDFWAGSSKTADSIAAGTDLGSSLSSDDEDAEPKQSSGDDLQAGVIAGVVIASLLAIAGIANAAWPWIQKHLMR